MDYYSSYYDTMYYDYAPSVSSSPASSSSYQNLDPRLKYYNNDPYKYQEKDQKNDDELWIETWLSKLGKIDINLESINDEVKKVDITPKKTPIKGTMSISAAKNALSRSLSIINKLQKTQDYMKTNVSTISSTEWKKYTVDIGNMKDELLSLLSHFDNFETINRLQYKIKQQRKKRLSVKKRKGNVKETIKKEREELKRVNEAIDYWLQNMRESVQRVKEEERLQKDADCVLAEVTKMKSEARKHLTLINALIKLRSLREKIRRERGERLSIEDERAFTNTTEKMIKMWENCLRSYKSEEDKLRSRFEANAMEDSNAVKLAKAKKLVQDWETVLFGPKAPYTSLYWGLTSAERDLETFIAIRKSWDTFLAQPYDENGTKIPLGWVLPNFNPNEDWSRYLEQ